MEQLYSYIESLDDCEIEIYFEDKSILDNCITEFKENANLNIIKKLKQILNEEYKNIEITQDRYYNQIREINITKNTATIYTLKYKFLKSIELTKDKNIIIFRVSKTLLNPTSFPNLHKYHITKKIIQSKFNSEYIDVFINNNISHIKLKSSKKINEYEKILNNIIEQYH